MQAMFDQQRKLLKLMQDKPEILDNINYFVQLLKDNGALVSFSHSTACQELVLIVCIGCRVCHMQGSTFQQGLCQARCPCFDCS